MKKKVYIETTIPSYLVSKPSEDIFTLTHQMITKKWWYKYRIYYDLYISEVVIQEIKEGNQIYANKRLEIVNDLPRLDYEDEIEKIAEYYLRSFNYSTKLLRDIYHLSFAVFHQMDYLLTWNCSHLANAKVRQYLLKLNVSKGLKTPDLCTPEELMNV